MRIKLSDGFITHIYKWEVKNPKGIMQIVHGSAEHAKRYEHFAKWLNKEGFTVWAIDLRGHGVVEAKMGNLGYFGHHGATRVIEDINEVGVKMKREYHGVPYTLLGHSMGSFIVRAVSMKHMNIDNVIAIGTNHQSRPKSFFNYLFCSLTDWFTTKKHRAVWLDKNSYKKFDKKIESKQTGEWISVSETNREKFLKDPLCGFTMTNNGFKTMAHWINVINSQRLISKQSKKKKVLFLAGTDDPVGNMGKEVIKAHKAYIKAKIDTEIRLYPNMRHEILNEKNRMQVYKDILEFLNLK